MIACIQKRVVNRDGSRFSLYTVVRALSTIGVSLLFAITVLPVTAQEYELLGTVDLTSRSGHYKDSPVVLDRDKDTWVTAGLMSVGAQHRFTLEGAELFIDHAISTRSAAPNGPDCFNGTGSTGSGGAGDSASATVVLVHDIYQGYTSVFPTDWFTFRAGRQRMNWGTAYTFSVTDGLHPQNPDADIETGFDGVSLSLRPTPDVSLELATAIQNAVATGEIGDLRYGVYASANISPVEIGATFVYQKRTILRPGMVGSVPIGPFMFVAEGAIELYDPRGEAIDYQPLGSVGAGYTWNGDATTFSFTGEYLYNSLAVHYPETVFEDISVSSDYAGGFARRGYRYLSGSVALNVLESWSTSHQLLTNLSDNSTYVSHSFTILRIPGVDLDVTVTWNSGKAGDEFGDLEQDFVVEFTTTVHF